MPPAATKSKYGKISKSQILTTPHPQGHVMSVRCEQPLDELTVQVWLLYDHPSFKYCTLYISGTELRTNGQTEDPNTRCPRRTFQAGGIKSMRVSGFPTVPIFSFRPKTFYCVWVSNHQNLEIDSYVFLLKVVWWLASYACKALHKQSAAL